MIVYLNGNPNNGNYASNSSGVVVCDYVLIPSIFPHLIDDNGASIKGKGVGFTRKRFNELLERAKREYGGDSIYALVFDIKSYFDSIPHSQCYKVISKYISDTNLVNIIIGIIESYKIPEIEALPKEQQEVELRKLANHEYRGICLGSEISQILAVAVPNEFDHYIKDYLRLKYYIRETLINSVFLLPTWNRMLYNGIIKSGTVSVWYNKHSVTWSMLTAGRRPSGKRSWIP